MHHLARHSVACFLTRGDLWCSWERGRDVFDKYLIDADWWVGNIRGCSRRAQGWWCLPSHFTGGWARCRAVRQGDVACCCGPSQCWVHSHLSCTPLAAPWQRVFRLLMPPPCPSCLLPRRPAGRSTPPTGSGSPPLPSSPSTSGSTPLSPLASSTTRRAPTSAASCRCSRCGVARGTPWHAVGGRSGVESGRGRTASATGPSVR